MESLTARLALLVIAMSEARLEATFTDEHALESSFYFFAHDLTELVKLPLVPCIVLLA